MPTLSSPHVRTFSTLNRKKKKALNRNLPSLRKNPPLYPVKSIKHSIQLAPPHPDQLAKALDKHRTLDKRGGKSQTNSPYNPSRLRDRCTHRHRQRRGLGGSAWRKWRCRYVIMALLIWRVGCISASSSMGRSHKTLLILQVTRAGA